MGTTQETNRPERKRENTTAGISPHVGGAQGYVAPTASAQVQFITIESREVIPEILSTIDVAQILPNDSEPTASAEVVIVTRGWASKLRVPDSQAGHLLETLTFGLGVGAIVTVCAAIMRFAGGSPEMRLALCAVCIVVIGGLTGLAIHRRHSLPTALQTAPTCDGAPRLRGQTREVAGSDELRERPGTDSPHGGCKRPYGSASGQARPRLSGRSGPYGRRK